MTEQTPAAVTDGMPGVARTELAGVTRQALWDNSWVSLMIVRKPDAGVNGYVYSHETRCHGRIVAVLPYRDVIGGDNGPLREYLVKSEMTPCWGFEQVLSAITGGYEGGDIEDDAVREMLEETGYAITRDELIPLGASFASKSADTVYSLFSVNLTGREAGEAIGDGSRLESESEALWVDAVTLATLRDPQLAVMCMRIPSTYEPADAAPPVAAPRPDIDRDPMWHRAYMDVQAVLDQALGTEEEDGYGAGIAADVHLLMEQRDKARAEVAELRQPAAPSVVAALDRDAVAAVLRKQLGTADFQAREVAGQICALMGGGGKEERPPRVTVDLNVRVRKHETYSAFDDVAGVDPASLRWGDRIVAVEMESSIAADAIVTGVDTERELVYLVPDWQGWTEDA